MASCLYVAPVLATFRFVKYEALDATSERHRLEIEDHCADALGARPPAHGRADARHAERRANGLAFVAVLLLVSG